MLREIVNNCNGLVVFASRLVQHAILTSQKSDYINFGTILFYEYTAVLAEEVVYYNVKLIHCTFLYIANIFKPFQDVMYLIWALMSIVN